MTNQSMVEHPFWNLSKLCMVFFTTTQSTITLQENTTYVTQILICWCVRSNTTTYTISSNKKHYDLSAFIRQEFKDDTNKQVLGNNQGRDDHIGDDRVHSTEPEGLLN